MFFYGTLMRGHASHDRFCAGYVRVEEAPARGRLYDLQVGFPALVVPEEDVHATGTADPVHDASQQRHRAGAKTRAGPLVFGELFMFDDFKDLLPALDLFEGYDPEGGPSLYRRVLIPVETSTESGVLAWTYVYEKPAGIYLPGGRWPAS